MSLFQCEFCGCCENTALTSGYLTFNHGNLDFSDFPERENLRLCSACTPKQFKSGVTIRKGGGWHGKFRRVFLPMGKFHTNKQGNLQHNEDGCENYYIYEIGLES